MATVNSLICWGGHTGKVVTMTIASPCVVTSTNHGLRDGGRLAFSTTGALPTGITAGVTYYAKSTAANTFNLYTDAALTMLVNTSGSQSGTHTAKSVLMLEYFTQYAGRWGDSGSERCYAGIVAAIAARGSASALDEEVWELGEAFNEIYGGPKTTTVYSAALRITSTINGVRTEAYHGGIIGMGFAIHYISTSQVALSLGWYGQEVDGFTVRAIATSGTASAVFLNIKAGCSMRRMILSSAANGGTATAVTSLVVIECCLIYGFGTGIVIGQYGGGNRLLNNIFVKNTNYGIYTTSGTTTQIYGFYYNNISIGNGTNWGPQSPQVEGASGNAGLSTDTPWVTAGGSSVSMATSDFMNWANNDFRPALSTSPQVDSGVSYYNFLPFDIADGERPNYNNGGAEALDVGCYEFDNGFGPHPASINLTLQGVVAGSEVRIYRVSDNTELAGVESCVINPTFTFSANVIVRIIVINVLYILIDFNYPAGEGDISIPINMEEDPWFKDPV